jgi:hypothetical protein
MGMFPRLFITMATDLFCFAAVMLTGVLMFFILVPLALIVAVFERGEEVARRWGK